MDINELKKLLKKSTAVLVLDEGEPSYVILDYGTYKEMVLKDRDEEKEVRINNGQIINVNGKETNSQTDSFRKPREDEVAILERINKDILAIKSEIENEEKMLGVD